MNLARIALAAAALAALAVAVPAAAQNSGWYIGGGIGESHADFERADFASLTNLPYTSADSSSTGAKIFGGYRLSPNVGVEFGFATLGQFKHRYGTSGASNATFNYDANALSVGVVGVLPLGSSGVSLMARGGAALMYTRLSAASTQGVVFSTRFCSTTYSDDCVSTKLNLTWGVGAQFDINPRWGLRFDYDDYGKAGDEFETGRATLDLWSMNVLFRF
ncbi:MAG: outer membrane beta-barrel protein [Burkholderiales bacterium]